MPKQHPRAGDFLHDEINGWHTLNIGKVVSLLESHNM
jgi:hypothetical protein